MEAIRKACQCPVCLQVLAVPVTWPCGHSFCKSCSFTMVKDFSDHDTGRVKCPTCRDDNRCSKIEKLQTNLVLHDLLVFAFGVEEITQRESEVNKAVSKLEALLKGPKAEDGEEFHGENAGEHDQGWQVIVHADQYNLTKDRTVTVERNIVRDNERFTHRLSLAPIANAAFIPTAKKHFSSWKMKFAVLEMEEDEMEDSGGFPPAISLPEASFLENAGAGNDDDQLIRTTFATDVLYCTVTMDGNELGEVESFETQNGVVSFYFGDLFENVQVDYGAQIKLHVTSEEEGMSCVVRYTFEKSQQQPKRFWLKREHRMESAAGTRDDDEEESEDSDEEEEREYVEEDEEDDDSSLDDFIVNDEDEEITYKKRKSRHVEEEEEEEMGDQPQRGGKKRRIVAVSDDEEEEDHEPEDDEYGERDHSNDDDDDEEDDRQRFLRRLDEEEDEL